MSTCSACGTSYEDNFRFCPHCGRAKTEPESINLNVRVAPVRHEEAVLKIGVVGTTELTEPPFDYRPSGLRKALGGGGKNWSQIATLRLLLDSMHPVKGKYLAFKSGTFRGIITPDFELPEILWSRFTTEKFSPSNQAHKWLVDLLHERHQCWGQFNSYLVGEGWTGLTKRAIDREAPFTDRLPPEFLNRDGTLRAHFTTMLSVELRYGGYPQTENLYDMTHEYRYRRLAM